MRVAPAIEGVSSVSCPASSSTEVRRVAPGSPGSALKRPPGWVDSATAAMRTGTEVPATFVMPHLRTGLSPRTGFQEAVSALLAQTDANWVLVIVDDASPNADARDRLLALSQEHVGKVTVMFQARHRGAGACRNIGVRWANQRGSPLVLFNDADDVSHPRRVEAVKRIMRECPGVGFVYSGIDVIDERGLELPRERLIPALQEILESHEHSPVEGLDGWIRMGTDTGYTCVTSTVAVRTNVAVAHPFPHVPFSEKRIRGYGCPPTFGWRSPKAFPPDTAFPKTHAANAHAIDLGRRATRSRRASTPQASLRR